MSVSNKLPAEAWGCLIIDNKECQGCFYQRRTSLDGRSFQTECWIELPRCGCPRCKVFCGSTVVTENGMKYRTVGNQQSTNDPDCIRWDLTEICDTCD